MGDNTPGAHSGSGRQGPGRPVSVHGVREPSRFRSWGCPAPAPTARWTPDLLRAELRREAGAEISEGAHCGLVRQPRCPEFRVWLLPASCPAWCPWGGAAMLGVQGSRNAAERGRGPHQPEGALAPQRQPHTGEGRRAGSSGTRDSCCLPTGHRGLEVRGHGGGQAVPMGVRGRVCARHSGALPASPLPDPHAF